MTLASILLIFFLSWWLVWMMVLPLGIRSRFEDKPSPEERHKAFQDDASHDFNLEGDLGAPLNPNLPKKLLLTTCISLGFVALFWLLMELGFVVWLGDSFMEWVTEFVTNSGTS